MGLLFASLLFSPYLRYQLGGKWSVPLIGFGFLIVLYLQPPVARWIHQWRADRRDEAEKRWWRERDKREQQAQLRAEALRLGKIQRDEKKK
jgi:hypothetical protein